MLGHRLDAQHAFSQCRQKCCAVFFCYKVNNVCVFLQLSDCKLLLSESHSTLNVCPGHGVDSKLLPLLHLPVKESRDYYALGDIVANGRTLDGRIVNVLAAVRSVSETPTRPSERQGQDQLGSFFFGILVVRLRE